MRDPRVDQLAQILVHYSTALQPGDRVLITGTDLAKPLLLSLYRTALAAGALPTLIVSFEETGRLLLDAGTPEQLAYFPPALLAAVEQAEAVIAVAAPGNLKLLTSADPQRQVAVTRARRPYVEKVLQRRWVLCQYPTPALAQEAEMSLEEYEDFVFQATNIDWPAMQAELHRWKQVLEAGQELRIVGPDTDLRLRIAGRTWIAGDGRHNMPDGEIFTGPHEDSAEGYITFDFPAIHAGREVEGVRLEFERGEVVRASATKGQAYLEAVLNADPGARRLGEIGLGLNYHLQRFTKSILFDEKIGGTVHLALGQSYRETGGVNQSSIHWDLIKDLRPGGAIYLDGRLIQQNGRFLPA